MELADPAQAAVDKVFDLPIPDKIAECEWSPVRYATRIHKRDELQELIGITVDRLLAQNEGFDLDDDVMLSAHGTLAYS